MKMDKKTPYRLPQHGQCFLCSPNSGSGVDIVFYTDGKVITGKTTLKEMHQGPPGHSHGGVLLALLDEAMGAAAWVNGYPVLAAHVEGDFKNPVPLGREIEIKAWVKESKGRKVFTEAEIHLDGGTLATVGKGIFIVAEKFFESKMPEIQKAIEDGSPVSAPEKEKERE
ncbi:MAG: PaaI family thioesterase [Planctomycetota bacterium]|nr:MAG: PaaI family thioesterase [Planctomycetota bacterium]